MKLGLYSIFDRKARTYGEPWLAANNDAAVRRFLYTGSQSPMLCNDLELFRVGTFDTDSGFIVNDENGYICSYEEKNAEVKTNE